MRGISRRSGLYVVGFIALVFAPPGGCSFISRTYQNTVAYFNTFYNAQKAYDDAVREMEKNQPGVLQTNLFLAPTVQEPVRQKFQAVIEKCSRIIQFYPETNLVDDAILLIGKSYCYINEVVPAQRKFSEILNNFPSSEHRLEAKLMLAKCHYLAGRKDEALGVTNTLIAEALENEEWNTALEALLLEGQIYLDRNEYNRAEQVYTRALETSGDERLLAYASYLLGVCQEAKGNIEAASRAFLNVREYEPPFLLEFHARLRAATIFSLLGNAGGSLEVLEELRSEPLNAEQRSQVELEIANTYRRAADYQKALSHYAAIDTLFKRTDASAKSNYYAATIYEAHLLDLHQAKILYDKARGEFPQSEITPLATKKAEILGRYVSYRNEFNKFDSLLYRYHHPEENIHADSTAGESAVRQDSSASIVGIAQDSAGVNRRTDSIKVTPISIDTIHYRRSINQLALGILFLIDLEIPDSSLYWLTMLLHDYPESKLAPQALYVLSEVYRGLNQNEKVDSLYDIILTRYPDSGYAVGILKRKAQEPPKVSPADSVEILYTRAINMLQSGNTQQAIGDLLRILSFDSTHALHARARYALGWIYENVAMNKDSAIVHYRRLLQQYPNSVYAARVQPKLAVIDNKESGSNPAASPAVDTTKSKPVQRNGEGAQQDEIQKPDDEKKSEPELKDDKP